MEDTALKGGYGAERKEHIKMKEWYRHERMV
jgi:hypothetical protein